ncbi:hypothetical protein SJS80_09630 [Aeromonas caviae]|uniref:hypothetical protein n=1 Tax=Aeromonas caviae TaxID=648 RepID=UPI0029DC062F|nr:hypothetical protein [Aeromonas caviae]MDX7762175.1 hypothetical protein [Aeromonas caviae]
MSIKRLVFMMCWGGLFFDFLLYSINTYYMDLGGVGQLYQSIIKCTLIAIFFCVYIYRGAFWNKGFFIDCVLLVIFGYVLLVVLINKDIKGDAGGNFINALDFHKGYLINYIFYYFLGKSIILVIDSEWFTRIVKYTFIIASCIILFSLDTSRTLFNSVIDSDLYKGSYLQIGDFFSIIVLVFLPYVNYNKKIHIVAFSLVILYFIGSRGSLYAFSFSILCVFLLSKLHSARENNFSTLNIAKFFLLAAVVLIAIYMISGEINLYEIIDIRMLAIIFGIENDYSMVARDVLMEQGLNDIISNPLSGYFAGQLYHAGDDQGPRWGAYIHSGLSYWRQFGLFPFLCYMSLWVYSIYLLWSFRLFKHTIRYQVSLLVFTFCFIETLFIRSYFSSYLMVAFGLISSLNVVKKNV